mgnify:FL=1
MIKIKNSGFAPLVENTNNQILQLWDSVSNRRCTLRMDPGDASLSLGGLLDKYLKDAPISQLLQESRITQPSADALYAMQDLVYLSTDAGDLKDMFSGMAFKEGEDSLALDQVPTNHQVQVEGQEVSEIGRASCRERV